MAKITFIEPGGNAVAVEADSGSLMEAAVAEGVDGIYGDCGGVCACATCHVRVREDWMERVGSASEAERDVLELEDGATERSRLCCQVEASEALDGLVVEVVEE